MPTSSKSQQVPTAPQYLHCLGCGAPMPPQATGRPRRTCDDACRQRYARKLVFEGVAERERLVKELAEQMLAIVRVPLTRPPAR